MIARVRGVIAASTAAGSSVSRCRVDIGEHRRRAGHHDRQGAERRRKRRRDHFVAGADAERSQRERERIGARADADREAGAGRGRKLLFERRHFGTEDEPAALDDALDALRDGRGVGARREREKWDA